MVTALEQIIQKGDFWKLTKTTKRTFRVSRATWEELPQVYGGKRAFLLQALEDMEEVTSKTFLVQTMALEGPFDQNLSVDLPVALAERLQERAGELNTNMNALVRVLVKLKMKEVLDGIEKRRPT